MKIKRGVIGWLAGTKQFDMVAIPGIDGDGFPSHLRAPQPAKRLKPVPAKPPPQATNIIRHRGTRHIVFWPDGTFTKGATTIRL